MKRTVWLCVVVAMTLGAAWGGEAARIVNYEISARLDTKLRAVEGHETLTWLNDSSEEVRELRFHLYMNAFRDEKSTFQHEADGHPEKDALGWIDVKSLRIAGGADLTKSMRFLHPDDDNAEDRTVMAVTLPEPLKAGRSISLEIDFHTKLGHVSARTGYHGDFYMVAQWFPKIGVWEKAGQRYATRGQWNCHQFHANSEFYADFGRYAVSLTVPSNYVVGATGVQESRREDPAAKTATYRFVQEDVHDFAWTASPLFLRIERAFEPEREVSGRELAETAKLLGIPEKEASLQMVRMILLIQPEHAAQIERHFKALRAGLKYFGLWYGKYPYPTITLVDPPYGGGAAGGMEYPTLFTAGTRWMVSERRQSPEMVVVHEFGHQFWYGMVANNEFEEAWLDEGFNTYSTSKILDKVYGPQDLSSWSRWLRGPGVGWDALNRGAYLSGAKTDSLLRNVWEYYDGSSYGINSYARAGLTLRTLENYLGEATMARILRTYFQRWRYRHPSTRDFIQVANEVSGQDLKWFFDQFVYGSNVVDYKVGEVESRETGDKKKQQYESVVKIRREGEAIVPVEIRVRFADGKTADRKWDGEYRWVKYTFTGPAKVESVEVDPGRKILLDVNFANNSYREDVAAKPLFKWWQNLLFWAESLLLTAGGIS
ncbi:MAG: M1 family metallopeptidase [Bryobacteraceae bacterium]